MMCQGETESGRTRDEGMDGEKETRKEGKEVSICISWLWFLANAKTNIIHAIFFFFFPLILSPMCILAPERAKIIKRLIRSEGE